MTMAGVKLEMKIFAHNLICVVSNLLGHVVLSRSSEQLKLGFNLFNRLIELEQALSELSLEQFIEFSFATLLATAVWKNKCFKMRLGLITRK